MKKALSLVLALMMLLSLCITPVMAAEPQGSESNPYYVANPHTAPGLVTIPANSTVYYQYKAAVFNGWEVGGYGLSAIIVDGVVYDQLDMWGELYTTLNFSFISPGIVGYVNNTDEDIEVTINHNEPMGTDNNPAEMVNGENVYTIPANVHPYNAVYVPTTSGEFTFACNQTENFGITITVDGVETTLDDTVTLTLESYIPVFVSIVPMGGTPTVTINVTAPKAGTETNPIWLGADEMDLTYGFAAEESLYFSVDGSLVGNNLTIESVAGVEFTALVDGAEYSSNGGSLSIVLDTTEWYIELILSSAADNEVAFTLDYAQGTYENPIELVDGDNALSYYYSYTAQFDGLLILTPADAAAFDLLDISYEDAEFNYHYGYLAEGAASALLPVPAGQTVIISACGVMNEETFINNAVETTLHVALKDLLLYHTFEGADMKGDLEGWASTSELVREEAGAGSNVANGFYSAEVNATNDWANMSPYFNVEANTDYEVTLKAMANQNGGLWIKFNDNWGPDVAQADLAITTEWNEYTVKINSGNCTNLVLLLQYNGYAADGQIFWLDDIVITKAEGGAPVVPPVDENGVVNGGFETGNATGWETWQSTEICTDAAHNGSFGAHLLGDGGWGGLLNQTFTVIPGQQYKLSFWINVNASGVNVQFTDGSGASIEGAGGWFDGSKKDHLVEWVFTATDDSARINFCGSGTGAAEDVYVDDITRSEMKTASFDGYVTNGDFETGDASGWETWQDTVISGDAAHSGSFGAHLLGDGSWGGLLNQTFTVVPGEQYTLSFWINVNNSGVNVQVTDGSGASIEGAGGWFDGSKKDHLVEWAFTATDDSVKINFCGSGSGNAEDVYVDDVCMAKFEAPVVDDADIVNGDFETGDNTGWEIWQSTTISGDAAHSGSFGAHLVGNGGWGGLLNQTFSVTPGQQYKLSFWINVNASGVNVQVTDGSGAAIEGAGGWFDGSKKDHLVEWVFTAADGSVKINFCGSGSGTAEDAYVDDFVLAEVKGASFDGYLTNGDFETGDTIGWESWQNTTVSGDAAYSGSFGAHLVGNGGWGGLLNQTIAVEAGKAYTITLWVKANNSGVNLLLTDVEKIEGECDNTYMSVDELDGWTLRTFNVVALSDSITLNFCGGGTGNPEDIYVDDIVVAEKEDVILPDVSFDGYITNGDFETGDLTAWENLWGSCEVGFTEGYESDVAISILAGNWSQVRQTAIAVTPNTDYVLTAWVKSATNFGIIVKTGDDADDIASYYIESIDEWQQIELKFNSADQTAIYVLLIGWEGGGSAIIDNVTMAEDDTPALPEYIPGDVNNDGKVNNKDLGILKQYLADWEVELNLNACDVDGSGRINNKDMGLLQQFLNDWDVELQYGAMAE